MANSVQSTGGNCIRTGGLTLSGNLSFVIAFKPISTPPAGTNRAISGIYRASDTKSLSSIFQAAADIGDNVQSGYRVGTWATAPETDDSLGTNAALNGVWVHLVYTINGTTGAQNIYALKEGFNAASPSFLGSGVSVGSATGTRAPDTLAIWDDGGDSSGTISIAHLIVVDVELTQAQALAQMAQRAPTAAVTAGNYTYLDCLDSANPNVDKGSTASNFTKTGTFSDDSSMPREWQLPPALIVPSRPNQNWLLTQ